MQLYKQEKGHMGQYEDWWHLRETVDGQCVVHSWDHVTVGTLKARQGENRYSIEDFLAGDHPEPAKEALRGHLETSKPAR